MTHVTVPIRRLDAAAKFPTSRRGDVGFDIYALEHVIIPPSSVVKVRTGLALAGYVSKSGPDPLKSDVFLKIEGRSSFAVRGIFPVGGIVDQTYRGEILGIMANINPFSVEISAGEKFAQLVMYNAVVQGYDFSVSFVETSTKDKTERGEGGFGSTGA